MQIDGRLERTVHTKGALVIGDRPVVDAKTGCGTIVNTSFTLMRGEPIICTPEDACRRFMRTKMDVLVLENCVLDKGDQPPLMKDTDWRKEFELD